MHPIARTLWTGVAAALLALVGGALLAASQAPDALPAHLDAGGVVTRWTRKSTLHWLLLPAIAIAVAGSTAWLSMAMRRRPGWINLPDKERFLALPPGRQAPVIARMQVLLAAAALEATLMLVGAAWLTWRGATGQSTEGGTMLLLGAAVLSTPLLLGVFLPWIQGELDRQIAAGGDGRAEGARSAPRR